MVRPPGERCSHVHDLPSSSAVTCHTSLGNRGCFISNRFPIARPGPSSAFRLVTEAVQFGQRSTSEKTSHTSGAAASMSMAQSVIMYQMVQERSGDVKYADWGSAPENSRVVDYACRAGRPAPESWSPELAHHLTRGNSMPSISPLIARVFDDPHAN